MNEFIATDEGEGYFYPSQDAINRNVRQFWSGRCDGTEDGLMGPLDQWEKKAAAWTLLEDGVWGYP